MNYTLVLKYFFIMSAMLLLSGLWMFTLHTSLTLEGVTNYYAPKSFLGLLETVNPHLFGMGILVFTITHFFAIIKEINQKKFVIFSTLFFLVMFLSNLSGFFIEKEAIFFPLLKLTSTLLFLLFSFLSYYFILKKGDVSHTKNFTPLTKEN